MQDNYLNRDEMLAALQEVGVFNGIRANKVGECAPACASVTQPLYWCSCACLASLH